MKKGALIVSIAVLLLPYLNSCDSGTSLDEGSISTDTAMIAAGKATFIQHCSGCHNFRQDGIGPQLGGVTAEVPADWIKYMIRDPKKMIESGDERATDLRKKYKAEMPSFATLADDEVDGIIAFLNTKKSPYLHMAKDNGVEIPNPITDTIELSNLIVELQMITQVPASGKSGEQPITRITKLDFEPHSGGLFIVDLRGRLYKLQNNEPFVYMDMAKLKPKFIHEPGLATGFGSFAFHPDFNKNGLLYTTHTEAAGSGKADFYFTDSIEVGLQWVLTEWKTQNPGATPFSGTSRELLRINMVTGIHGVQEITFNPLSKPGTEDYGKLYIGVGDGGCVDQGFPFLAHDTEKIWGTVLRIDPAGNNSANGQYGIPRDNPFVKNQNTKVLREIYAYGFRNPHRISWTSSGKMLVSNIGHRNIESVNLILPGHDYGWPIREGTFLFDPYGDLNKVYPLHANDSTYNVTYPVVQYDHDEGLAISGGFEYWGSAIPQLKGKFLFGDISPGKLFYINTADVKLGKQAIIKEWQVSMNGTLTTLKDLCEGQRVALHFGRDSRGELYILTHAGKVYKLVSAALKS